MTQTKARTLRLPREVRKAVFSGDGYEDYKTILQFHTRSVGLIKKRIAKMEQRSAKFFADGGTMKRGGDGEVAVSMKDVVYRIRYKSDGSVASYSVENPTGNEEALHELHALYFTIYMLPVYRNTLAFLEKGIADMENSVVLKGLGILQKILREDRYLTTAAVSGLQIQDEDDVDPFEVFGNE